MKKFFAAVLTLAMVATLAVPALAASVTSAGTAQASSGNFTGSIIVPTLNITLKYYGSSATGGSTVNSKLVLNPYGTLAKGTGYEWLGSDGSSEQVLASPINVKSLSNSAVDVVLVSGAKANAPSTITMQSKEINNTKAVSTPQAYLYMCATSGENETTLPTELPSYDKNSCWLMNADSAKDITLYTLAATDGNAANAVYCWVSITGNLSTMFTDDGTPWASTDTISPTGTLKFNFAMASE